MLQRLVSVDFRSFSSHFSFASWADELYLKPKETTPKILEVQPEELAPEVPTPAPSERVPLAEDLCSLLDSVVDDELAEAIRRVEEVLQESRLNYGHMFLLLRSFYKCIISSSQRGQENTHYFILFPPCRRKMQMAL